MDIRKSYQITSSTVSWGSIGGIHCGHHCVPALWHMLVCWCLLIHHQGMVCPSQAMKRPLSSILVLSMMSRSCLIARSLLKSFSGFTFCTHQMSTFACKDSFREIRSLFALNCLSTNTLFFKAFHKSFHRGWKARCHCLSRPTSQELLIALCTFLRAYTYISQIWPAVPRGLCFWDLFTG